LIHFYKRCVSKEHVHFAYVEYISERSLSRKEGKGRPHCRSLPIRGF